MKSEYPYTEMALEPEVENPCDPSLKVLILYETILGCLMAKLVYERLSKLLDCPVDTTFCSFSLLSHPNHHLYACRQMRETDCLLIAKSEKGGLPSALVTWLDSCLEDDSKENQIIVGVFTPEEGDQLENLESFRYLRKFITRCGMKFSGLSFPQNTSGYGESLVAFESAPPSQTFADLAGLLAPRLSRASRVRI